MEAENRVGIDHVHPSDIPRRHMSDHHFLLKIFQWLSVAYHMKFKLLSLATNIDANPHPF